MNAPTLLRASMLGTVLAALAPAQAWTDDQLVAACAGFQIGAFRVKLFLPFGHPSLKVPGAISKIGKQVRQFHRYIP